MSCLITSSLSSSFFSFSFFLSSSLHICFSVSSFLSFFFLSSSLHAYCSLSSFLSSLFECLAFTPDGSLSYHTKPICTAQRIPSFFFSSSQPHLQSKPFSLATSSDAIDLIQPAAAPSQIREGQRRLRTYKPPTETQLYEQSHMYHLPRH